MAARAAKLAAGAAGAAAQAARGSVPVAGAHGAKGFAAQARVVKPSLPGAAPSNAAPEACVSAPLKPGWRYGTTAWGTGAGAVSALIGTQRLSTGLVSVEEPYIVVTGLSSPQDLTWLTRLLRESSTSVNDSATIALAWLAEGEAGFELNPGKKDAGDDVMSLVEVVMGHTSLEGRLRLNLSRKGQMRLMLEKRP